MNVYYVKLETEVVEEFVVRAENRPEAEKLARQAAVEGVANDSETIACVNKVIEESCQVRDELIEIWDQAKQKHKDTYGDK